MGAMKVDESVFGSFFFAQRQTPNHEKSVVFLNDLGVNQLSQAHPSSQAKTYIPSRNAKCKPQ
jgi:hypothetical protein